MMKSLLFALLGFLAVLPIQANTVNTPKTLPATRLTSPPAIDGILEPGEWQDARLIDGFVQFEPVNGQTATERTEVMVGYDDQALYVAVMMYDSEPEKIQTELSERDQCASANADQVTLHISPFADGNNSFLFRVSAANVQEDRQISPDGPDPNWDGVWESAVSIHDKGWCVEYRIPYSALRFPAQPVQNWGFNVHRNIIRKGEISVWSPVSNERENWWVDMGTLARLKDLNPPIRLSFTPYLSTYAERQGRTDAGQSSWESIYKGGLDLKYGLTDAFTLDMTLIPDFGQVQSDDRVLNLSPFETYYSEKRPFFTEGTELFNKGGLFYSRRIGKMPTGYFNAYGSLRQDEKISDNPVETRMINATKISGRTTGGLGIGLFNAITARSQATLTDTLTGEKRKIETQPLTNYNVTVVDKTLKNNGYLSVANSNVSNSLRKANVTAATFRLATAGNIWAVEGQAAVSHVDEGGSSSTGSAYEFQAGKVSGTWQYVYGLDVMTDRFNKNDLGYMRHNDVISQGIHISHNIFKPFSSFLNWSNVLGFNTSRQYHANNFNNTSISYEIHTTTKQQWRINMHALISPIEQVDYYEARQPGRKLILTKVLHNCASIVSDRRRPVYFMAHGYVNKHYDNPHDRLFWGFTVEPYLRFSDKMTLGMEWSYSNHNDDLGWVNTDAATGDIYIGRRAMLSQTATLLGLYRLNSKASFSLRLRHYHSQTDHNAFFRLKENGRLAETGYTGEHDINYNAFNLHANFIWHFAPGSELILAWKHEIEHSGTIPDSNYFRNIEETLDSPRFNSISLKVMYYLDWLSIMK